MDNIEYRCRVRACSVCTEFQVQLWSSINTDMSYLQTKYAFQSTQHLQLIANIILYTQLLVTMANL